MSHVDDGRFAAYLDGETDHTETTEIREHTEACANCRARLDDLRRVREQARAILRSSAPVSRQAPALAELAARARVRESEAAQRRQLGQLRRFAWAASVVLAVAVGWYAREASFRPRAETVPRGAVSLDTAAPLVVSGEPAEVRRSVSGELASGAGGGTRVAAPAPALRDEAKSVRMAPPPEPDPRAEADRLAQREPRLEIAPPAAAPQARQAAPPELAGAANEPEPWTPVDLGRATAALGQPPLIVPGLELLGYATHADQQGAVRVTQQLGDEVLELIQVADAGQLERAAAEVRAADAPAARGRVTAPSAPGAARMEPVIEMPGGVTVRMSGVRVTGRAAIPADSLSALLRRLR